MSDATMVGEDRDLSADAIVGRLFEAAVGGFDLLSVVIGDRLGLYGSLARDGSATSGELATRAGIAERYAREWLEQQAASGILVVDDAAAAPDQRRFTLPPGHAEALTDPESPYSIAPVARAFAACAGVLPQLLDAYRSGGGVEWSDYGRDMIEAQGDFNRPWLVNSFGSELPAGRPGRPRTVDRRPAGARRRRRMRRRLGVDRDRPCLSERAGRRLRPRSALDRPRACERGGRRRGRPGDVRDARRRAILRRPAGTTWRS